MVIDSFPSNLERFFIEGGSRVSGNTSANLRCITTNNDAAHLYICRVGDAKVLVKLLDYRVDS